MTYGGYGQSGLRSPNRHFLLGELDGAPDAIEAAGNHYIDIGARMSSTADELQKLGDSEKYTAKSLDKVRESARELHGELRKVGVRYEKTGPVLVTYAGALRTARDTTVDPFVEKIRAAHQAHQDAIDARDEAQDTVDDNNTTWIWEDEATDAEKANASSALAGAKRDERAAEQALDALWVLFESGFAAWDQAYDDAVGGIEDAMDASGVNDSWWEDFLDGIATVATVVATIAVIAALVIGGPIFLAIAAVASIVALAAHCIMMACGSKRVSWTDIAFDAIGVLPFLGAFGKGLKGGPGRAREPARGHRTVGSHPGHRRRRAQRARPRPPTVVGAGRTAGNRAARELAAPGLARTRSSTQTRSMDRQRVERTPRRRSILDGQAFTISQRLAQAWPGAGRMGSNVTAWTATYGAMPGLASQGLNVWNAGYGVVQTGQIASLVPDTPDFIGGAVDWIRGR